MSLTSQTFSLSDEDYTRFRDFLGRYCGLHYPESRRNDLAHGLGKALKTSGYNDLDEYYDRLVAHDGRGPEMDRLVSTLTVGESYFFRIQQHFDALNREIFPRLILDRARTSRRIRIWSAGCAGGEEAYSLAIALRQSLPSIDTWNITILATDIDQDALRRAREGAYGEWSFREMDRGLRDLFFTHDGRRWTIKDEIKRMVEFDYLNLIEDSYPSLTTNTNAMDVIFCRNVTIYFSQETTTRVIKKLYNALVDGGHLFVGASEPNLLSYREFSAKRYGGSVAYQKDAAHEPPRTESPTSFVAPPLSIPATPAASVQSAAPAPTSSDAPHYDTALVKLAEGNIESALDYLFRQIEERPDHAASYALLAKTHANQGKLEQAQHWCERAIREDRLLAEAHYTLGLIYDEQGFRDKATESLRRTLFLDRQHVLAHYVLGTLYRQANNESMARKSWENAVEILKGRDPREVVPDSDGVTSGRLLQVIQGQLSELGKAVSTR